MPPSRPDPAAPPPGDRFTLGDPIADGGMGHIVEAEQETLGRTVAVKLPRDRAGAREALMREARVTGFLAHPNIVPVHTLTSHDGRPMLVMKRIEGVPWSRLLEDDATLAAFLGGRDRLLFHLDVLMTVARAVHFAHDRGVVHRDLKPDNVMVGRHGEVTVLDWGLAAATKLAATDRLPLVRDSAGLAGTPAYMAPEQARGDSRAQGVHTDVFALGAMLHQVLTGAPPYAGDDVDAVLAAAVVAAPPTYGPGVPADLADLAGRCMRAVPSARPASAEEVRRRLQDSAAHRDSAALTDAARIRVDRLNALVGRALAGGEVDAAEVNDALVEARFGLRQALVQWPDNPDANGLLQRVLRAGVRFAVHRGNHPTAAQLLGQLDHPSADLVADVAALAARLDRTAADLEELDRRRAAADPSRDAGRRSAAGCLVGAVVASVCAVLAAAAALSEVTWMHIAAVLPVFDLAVVAATAGLHLIGRPDAVARQHARLLVALTLSINIGWAGAWFLGLPLSTGFAVNCLVAGTGLLIGGVTVPGAGLAPALAYLAGFVGILAVPPAALVLYTLANAAAWTGYTIQSGALLLRSRHRDPDPG